MGNSVVLTISSPGLTKTTLQVFYPGLIRHMIRRYSALGSVTDPILWTIGKPACTDAEYKIDQYFFVYN